MIPTTQARFVVPKHFMQPQATANAFAMFGWVLFTARAPLQRSPSDSSCPLPLRFDLRLLA
jgi:hypothetical protein